MDSIIRSFNLETGGYKTYEGHKDWVHCMEIHDGRLFSGGDDKIVIIWDIKTTKALERLNGHENGVTSLCFVDGNLYTGSYDNHIICWDLNDIEDRIEERAEMY